MHGKTQEIQNMLNWLSDAWYDLPDATIVHSFRQCGIAERDTATYGHLLRELLTTRQIFDSGIEIVTSDYLSELSEYNATNEASSSDEYDAMIDPHRIFILRTVADRSHANIFAIKSIVSLMAERDFSK